MLRKESDKDVFNILVEMAMRETLDGFQRGLQIGGRMIMNLHYADDIIPFGHFRGRATGVGGLSIDRVSCKYSLPINVDEIK